MEDNLARLWTRNVMDEFKNKSNEDINTILRSRSNPFSVAFEHWQGDFNMSTGFRNANGFNAEEMMYIGPKPWDRRGSVGSHNYMSLKHFKTVEEFYTYAIDNEYVLVGIDNVPGSISICSYDWKKFRNPIRPLLVFGEESIGLTPEIQKLCMDIVHIPMFGSVRSFNCGTASGIAMYDLISKLNA